jgi:hypothetical protein
MKTPKIYYAALMAFLCPHPVNRQHRCHGMALSTGNLPAPAADSKRDLPKRR